MIIKYTNYLLIMISTVQYYFQQLVVGDCSKKFRMENNSLKSKCMPMFLTKTMFELFMKKSECACGCPWKRRIYNQWNWKAQKSLFSLFLLSRVFVASCGHRGRAAELLTHRHWTAVQERAHGGRDETDFQLYIYWSQRRQCSLSESATKLRQYDQLIYTCSTSKTQMFLATLPIVLL